MESDAGEYVVEGMLQGIFGVLGALLGDEFQTAPGSATELAEGELGGLLAENPVVLRTQVQHGLGAVALLLPLKTAAALAAAVGEGKPSGSDALSAAEQASLGETVEPVLGGGVSTLMERFGRNVEQLEHSGLLADARQEADDLSMFLGIGPTLARFRFEGQKLSGSGALLIGHELVALVPRDEEGEDRGPMLSEAEMGDILSGFGPETSDANARGGPDGSRRAPGNLDMVLDIRLVATARLGRVEMPIGDILNLGPGSIIEIGQLVDEAIELLINDKLVARGDVVVVDEKFGLRITEIVSQQERIESLR